MPRKKKWPYPLVIIKWDDAVVHTGEREGPPKHTPAKQVSIGWLMVHNDKGVTYCSEYSEDDGSYRDENFIPAGMITEVIVKKMASREANKKDTY